MENSIRDITRHWGSDGEDYHFQYDLAKGETRVVDSISREQRYYWGALYEVYHHIDALGQCWHSDLLAGQLLKTTDAQGGEWHYVYDDIGHLIESERPGGRIDRYQRNLAGQLTDYIDPANQRT
ncbi:hypothetical protein, partial [Pseudomonas fluorescens]